MSFLNVGPRLADDMPSFPPKTTVCPIVPSANLSRREGSQSAVAYPKPTYTPTLGRCQETESRAIYFIKILTFHWDSASVPITQPKSNKEELLIQNGSEQISGDARFSFWNVIDLKIARGSLKISYKWILIYQLMWGMDN